MRIILESLPRRSLIEDSLTSRGKQFFLHEPLPESCGVSGCIVMEQMRAIDLDARPTKLVGHLDDETLDDVLACV